MGFFDKAFSAVSSAVNTVAKPLNASVIKPLTNSVIKPVIADAKSVVSFAGQQFDKLTDLPGKALDKAGDIFVPLGIAAAAIAGLVLLKQ